MNINAKLVELQSAINTIKRLIPDIEREISLMGGVGTARKDKKNKRENLKRDLRKTFIKNLK